MKSTAQIYQHEMHGQRGLFATWLPADRIELGDVGVIVDGRFSKAGSLRELKIRQKVSAPSSPQTLRFDSTSETSVGTTASADVPGAASAEIRIKFGSRGSFLFHALDVRLTRLEDRLELGNELVDAYERVKWEPQWYLIDTVYEAGCATILIARGESAEVILGAKANVGGSAFLADPKLGLEVRSTRGVVSSRGRRGRATPDSCLRVADSWSSGPAVKPVRGAGKSPAFDTSVFETVPLEALKYAPASS